jgi:two-component system LytT family response regulator
MWGVRCKPSRCVIVNMEHLQGIIREGQNGGSVVLTNGQRLKMSKAGWQNLLAVTRA